MDTNEKLNVLFDMTEQQQAAIGEAVAALIKQNERLENTGGALQRIIENAIIKSMNGTTNAAKSAVDEALAPALQNMNNTIEIANNAKSQLNRAATALTWKLWFMAFGVAVAIIASSYLNTWWQKSELENIKENLAIIDTLRGQINVLTCNGLPCVEVTQVYDKNPNVYVLKGVKFK